MEKIYIDYNALGKRIRNERVKRNMSQAQVSEKVNLSESYYGNIERGARILSLESLVRISEFFNCSLDYLLVDSISKKQCEKEKLEFLNILSSKSSQEISYLLNILKVLADNIEVWTNTKKSTLSKSTYIA